MNWGLSYPLFPQEPPKRDKRHKRRRILLQELAHDYRYIIIEEALYPGLSYGASH